MNLADFPRLLEVLTSAWETTGGQALRRLLWSIRGSKVCTNGSVPAVFLWDALTLLDDGLRVELACLISQSEPQRETLVKLLLVKSGEWDRIDVQPLHALPVL